MDGLHANGCLRECLVSPFPRDSTHYGAVRGIVHDDRPSADRDMIPDGNGPEDRRIGADGDVIPDAYLAWLRTTRVPRQFPPVSVRLRPAVIGAPMTKPRPG